MDDIDQRRFDNRPSPDWLPARDAARRLGVKLESLYSYASRGLLRSVPGGAGRARRYAREDVERLRVRHAARSGHGPVAAGALRWGEPVLDSSITEITLQGPRYRGALAVDLVSRGVRFERTAELLWTGALPPAEIAWEPSPSAPRAAAVALRLARRATGPLPRLAALTLALAADEEVGALSGARELSVARSLVAALPLALTAVGNERSGGGRTPSPGPSSRGAEGLARRRGKEGSGPPASVAARVAAALGARTTSRDATSAIDAALVLVADHELNASTFTVRVAASAGAGLFACVSAGLATLSGPRHGGMCDRVEALVREVGTPCDAATVLGARARRGELVPGFGHPFYPAGDPRAVPLLAAARGLARKQSAAHVVLAVVQAMEDAGGESATIDLGLVALALALELPAGSAAALFAIGRCAGWIAHAREQRESGVLLRPRARYVPG